MYNFTIDAAQLARSLLQYIDSPMHRYTTTDNRLSAANFAGDNRLSADTSNFKFIKMGGKHSGWAIKTIYKKID